jgi:hypothetical protein
MPLSDLIVATEADAEQVTFVHCEAIANDQRNAGDRVEPIPKERFATMVELMALDIARPTCQYLIIKDEESGKVVSYVKWELPYDGLAKKDEEEAYQKRIEQLKNKHPSSPLGIEFMDKIRAIRKTVLGDPQRPNWSRSHISRRYAAADFQQRVEIWQRFPTTSGKAQPQGL